MIAEMKREILLPLLVLCLCRLGAAQYFAVSGNCELPGQAVVVSGMSQSGTKPLSGGALTTGSGVMASYPQCKVTVYPAGSSTPLATGSVYADATGTVLGNPFTANTDGSWIFYVPAACYDVALASGTSPPSQLPAPRTLSGKCAGGGGAGGASPAGSGGNLQTNNGSGGLGAISNVAAGSQVVSNQAGTGFITQAKPVVDVRDYGVIGDGQAVTDCSISAASVAVSCTAARFVAGDVGKSVGMWEAGPTVTASGTNYLTALTSTILSYQSATQVTLANNASNTANPSPHFVWGTNNYTAIGTAREAANALYPNGYDLHFPQGYYLTPIIDFPCGAIGTFGANTCATATKNLTISGAAMGTTIVENFKADRGYAAGPAGECHDSTYHCDLIRFGVWSAEDGLLNDAAHWVNGVTVHDLTLIESENGNGNYFNEPGNIGLGLTSNAEVFNVNMQESSYACIHGGNPPVSVHNNIANHCGWGGPAYAGTSSALNTVVPYAKIYDNSVYYSGQCIEMSAPYAEVINNRCEAKDPSTGNWPVTPTRAYGTCLNLGSATYGYWNMVVKGNICKDWASGGSASNGSGVMSNLEIENNTFINTQAFTLEDGLEGSVAGYPAVLVPPTTHGTSYFTGNRFIFDSNYTVATQAVGIFLKSQREKWVVDNNTVVLPGGGGGCTDCAGLVLKGSFPAWQPSTTYTQSANNPSVLQPPMPNTFWYIPTGTSGTCVSGTSSPTFPLTLGGTVSDGTCTLQNMGAKPVHTISNLHLSFPSGSTNGASAIQDQGLLFTDFHFSDITASGNAVSGISGIGFNRIGWSLTGFPVESWAFGNDAYPSVNPQIIIRSASPYSSSNQMTVSAGTLPAGEYFRANDVVMKTTVVAGAIPGWQFTSSGWNPKSWVAGNAYPYNSLFKASPDNGHQYIVTDAAGCTSNTPLPPAFSTVSGSITADGTCHDQEAGLEATYIALGNVSGPASSTTNHLAEFADATGTVLKDGGAAATGNVTGPGSSTTNHVAEFADSSGTVLKDGGAAGSGTVTNSGGNLTANAVVLGAGTNDTKVSTGITSDGGSELDVGVLNTTSGIFGMYGSTSGKATCTAPP